MMADKAITEQHKYRDPIPPVPNGTPRPLWSVMIPTYNCAHYLRETLTHVLAQDPGPATMQIEVVDDGSTDGPAAVVAELGRGRVAFYQQPRNVGHTRNFNTCLQRARGNLVHLLHGDDGVRQGFYATMQRAFETRPDIGAAFCRVIIMDEQSHWQSIYRLEQQTSGVLDHWFEQIAVGQRLQPPSMVVRREVYERVGGFDHRIAAYGEDWEMWVRIAALYPVWYEVEPLALYRIHSTSLSGRTLRTGENMQDLRRALEIIHGYLPPSRAEELTAQAREACALGAIRRGHRMLAAGDLQSPLAQMREAIKFSHSPRVASRLGFLFARWVWHAARPTR